MSKLITAEQLSLGYDGKKVIDRIDFSIDNEDFVFITGVSGSGKTTLIRSLYGEISPMEGNLNVGGYNLNGIRRRDLMKIRQFMGVVFQDYKLIPEWNVLRNVMLPLIIRGYDKVTARNRAMRYLEKVNMAEHYNKSPLELSGGEQQRVAIARATVHEPVLVVADEPVSGLDTHSAQLVMELFKEANKNGITVIIATHSIPDDLVPLEGYRHFRLDGGKIYEIK
jgi:cell division transport system ATP-binding protein